MPLTPACPRCVHETKGDSSDSCSSGFSCFQRPNGPNRADHLSFQTLCSIQRCLTLLLARHVSERLSFKISSRYFVA